MTRIATLLVAIAASCSAQQFADVKRICVEQLNGDRSATQIRDMIIAALQQSGRFILTENPERADAVLKGSAEDLVFTDTFQTSDGLSARAGVGNSIAGVRLPSLSVGENESQRISERKHEAFASVRLVNKDGDIIWSTTQESLGAKFRGASADVAGKVTRQLISDIGKAAR
jgi:hypothetical protein